MTIEDAEKLKPIPKYIRARIERMDRKFYGIDGHLRFYSYYALWKRKELIKITVAVRHYRKKLYMKQVAIHALHGKLCFVKDLEYSSYLTMGYKVGWYSEGIGQYKPWYERGWGWAEDKYYNPFAPCVNTTVVDKLPEFKYSAYKQYRRGDLFKYLRTYEKYPQAEMFVKFGLSAYALSKQLLEKAAKDKKFRTWLIQHKTELSSGYHYVSTILLSYKTGKSLKDTQRFEEQKKSFCNKNGGYSELRRFFKGRIDKFLEYIEKQNTSIATYNDYYKACTYLELDMTEDKNVFPHDFKRWHDIRIDEYHTAKAMKDAEERKELYAHFAAIAEKYLRLQHSGKHGFIAVIAKSPAELITEGDVLHHCVGRMGYDQRFVREESLIFFIRLKEKPDVPFVTVEYSPKTRKILQLHGAHNAAPNEETKNYIERIWLPFANKQMKAMAA